MPTQNEVKELLDAMFRSALQLAELAEAPEERYMATLAWQHTLAITDFLGYAVRLGTIGGRCQVELVRKDKPAQEPGLELELTEQDRIWLRAMRVSLTEPTPSLSPGSEGT